MKQSVAYFEDYLQTQLQKCYKKGHGYAYQIVITQGKKRRTKNMRLIWFKNKDGKRTEYSLDNAYWITINVLQRMKSFWGFHRGRCVIRIKPISHKKV